MRILLPRTAYLAALLLGAAPALAQTIGPPGSPVPSVRTTESAPSDPTVQFVRKAAIGDRFEIEAGKLAMEKARNVDVRAFGAKMADDHGRLAAQMRQTLQPPNAGVAIPTELDEAHARKLDALRAADGDGFDRLYLQTQQEAHAEALALHRDYAANGDHTELRALAETAQAIVEEHVRHLRRLVAQ